MPIPSGKTAKRTDLENAERMVEMYADDLRYIGSWGKGLAWDGSRWTLDDSGYWHRAAIRTTRILLVEAQELLEGAGDDKVKQKTAKASYAWAVKSQSAGKLRSMIDVAKSSRPILVHHTQLDANPWLFNVQNGTVDLRTGELREHRREDLMTKIAPVDYDPDANCPLWDRFLDRVMGHNSDIIEYLQRIIGYALTGSVEEHVLVFFWGGGANGKSTFLSTMQSALGDYAVQAPRGLLFRSHGERHPTEYATLHGRRFVTCSEIEEGQAFDESLTKDLTGGDTIECRRMREDFWSFQPTHKLFLAGNHKPTVRGDDEGIWRRMRLVPWVVTIPAEDRDLKLMDKLREELSGILAWAVRGCLAWQRNGLQTPPAVAEATQTYREENDILGEFLRMTVTFERDATISRRDLREAYEAFCREAGVEPFGGRRVAGRLREHDVTHTTMRQGVSVVHGWRGVRLMTDAERAVAVAWNGTRQKESSYKDDDVERQAIVEESAI